MNPEQTEALMEWFADAGIEARVERDGAVSIQGRGSKMTFWDLNGAGTFKGYFDDTQD